MVIGDGGKEGGDLGVAVDPHAPGKQGMVECIIGIVLAGVVLTDDRIGGQVQQEPPVLSEKPADHLPKAIVLDDVPDDQVGTDPQAAAPLEVLLLLGELGPGEVPEIVLVGIHHRRVVGRLLSDGGPLGYVELPHGIIGAVILIVDVGRLLDVLADDFPWYIGDTDKEIKIHLHLP